MNVDIAGLVKGASKGEGPGNQFLTNIRETSHRRSVALKMTTLSTSRVKSIGGRCDIINTELALSDLDTTNAPFTACPRRPKAAIKTLRVELAALEKCLPHGKAGMLPRWIWSKEEKEAIRYLSLTLKPTMYIANALTRRF